MVLATLVGIWIGILAGIVVSPEPTSSLAALYTVASLLGDLLTCGWLASWGRAIVSGSCEVELGVHPPGVVYKTTSIVSFATHLVSSMSNA